MRRLPLIGLLLWLALLAVPAAGKEREHLQVFITAPYLELRSGPGRGYPVFHVAERDESVEVLYRRTDWFKVRTERGVEGWAAQRDMLRTVLADGTPFKFDLGDRSGFTSHRWEMGVFAGDYGGATLVSGYTSFSLNSQLAAELSVGQFLGKFSNGITGDLGFTHVLVPEWRLSPFLMLGTGLVHITPKATLVLPTERTDQTAYVGGGLRFYLTRRFFVRAEYKSHMVFTKRNQNEEVDEWKLGFAFFF
ncbi:MAG TPA: SH3 domain-containing protein [Steroidobacteraceae bacterium]|nr:SH3 domain-containing protein [Steroidobacteraceae bacterium]